MSIKHDAYGIPFDDPNQHGRRALAEAMLGRPNNGIAGTMPAGSYAMPAVPAASAQPTIGMGAGMRDTLGSAAGGTMLGGAFGGPIGALAGGAIGAGIQRVRLGTPSQKAGDAMASGWDGFGGTAPSRLPLEDMSGISSWRRTGRPRRPADTRAFRPIRISRPC